MVTKFLHLKKHMLKLSPHSKNFKLQFQHFYQNPETIISVYDSSDNEPGSFQLDFILEKTIKTIL